MHLKIGEVDDPTYAFRFSACTPLRMLDNQPADASRCQHNSGDISSLYDSVVWGGIMIDFAKTFARIMNFTYSFHVPNDNLYGALDNTTGKWSGVLGALEAGDIDLAGAPLTNTRQRQQYFDFVPIFPVDDQVFVSTRSQMLAGHGAKASSIQSLLDFTYVLSPFEVLAWLCIVGSGALVVLTMAGFEVIGAMTFNAPIGKRKQQEKFWSWKSKLILFVRRTCHQLDANTENVLGIAVFQDGSIGQRAFASRLLVICWALVCTALTSVYAAQMASNALVKPSSPPFTSYLTMQKAGYRFLILDNSWAAGNLAELANVIEHDYGDVNEANALRAALVPPKQTGWPHSVPALFEAVHSNVLRQNGGELKGPFAVYGSPDMIYGYQTLQCNLHAIDVPYKVKNAFNGFAFRQEDKNLSRWFRQSVQKLRSSGMIDYILNTRQPEWLQASLNVSMALPQICPTGTLSPINGGKTFESRPRSLEAGWSYDARPGRNERTAFSAMSLFTLRAVFMVLVFGVIVGLLVFTLELGVVRGKVGALH